jgi:hypothetical protein
MTTPCQARPTSLLPEFWTVGKIDKLKDVLRESLLSTDIGVQACPSLPDAQRAEWGIFYATAMQWAQSDTSVWLLGSQADQGQTFQDQLFCQQQTLNSYSCAVPMFNPVSPSALDPQGAVGSTLRVLTVAAAVLAGAYVVGKVTDVTLEAMRLAPHPKRS